MTAKAKPATPATSSRRPSSCSASTATASRKGHGSERTTPIWQSKLRTSCSLVLASNDPKVADLATRLPVGRVHATGRTFVPFIRRDLYDKLVAAAPNGNAHSTSPPASGSSGAAGANRLAARRPTCPRLGRRSASAIWSSPRRDPKTAGMRQ